MRKIKTIDITSGITQKNRTKEQVHDEKRENENTH